MAASRSSSTPSRKAALFLVTVLATLALLRHANAVPLPFPSPQDEPDDSDDGSLDPPPPDDAEPTAAITDPVTSFPVDPLPTAPITSVVTLTTISVPIVTVTQFIPVVSFTTLPPATITLTPAPAPAPPPPAPPAPAPPAPPLCQVRYGSRNRYWGVDTSFTRPDASIAASSAITPEEGAAMMQAFAVPVVDFAAMTSEDAPRSADGGSDTMQVVYPAGTIAETQSAEGTTELTAQSTGLAQIGNATLEYSVYFPSDFDFAGGGKLPGLYRGPKDCSAQDSTECFSTKLQWRNGGKGEVFLDAPSHGQTVSLCNTPPYSACDDKHGLSIGRGAFRFAKGDWTHIRHDAWLNTPGRNDGGFNIWVNGRLAVHSHDVMFRPRETGCFVKTKAGMQAQEAGAADADPAQMMWGMPDDTDWAVGTAVTEESVATAPISDDAEAAVVTVFQTNTITATTTSTLSHSSLASTAFTGSVTSASPTSSQGQQKRSPFDNGQWKGINGYPGDPSFTGAAPAPPIATATPGAVYTWTFTEVVTVPGGVRAPKPTPKAAPPPPKKPAAKPPAKAKKP